MLVFDVALWRLGYCYEDGIYVEQDYQQALHYYELAAKQGNVRALCSLGLMYEDGRGVPVDFTKAVDLLSTGS